MIIKNQTRKPIGLILISLLVACLAAPSVAVAKRGHNHYRHHHHKHHTHHNQHRFGHVQIYRQAPIYYQQYYPQPQYNYYAPAPVYISPPPQFRMGISTGNMDFMLRY